jgi:hypothetical protein
MNAFLLNCGAAPETEGRMKKEPQWRPKSKRCAMVDPDADVDLFRPSKWISFAKKATVRHAAIMLLGLGFLVPGRAATVGSWTHVINQPFGENIEEMLLLSDGTVLCQSASSGDIGMYILIPDPHGSYVNGDWFPIRPMNYARNAYGKCLLRDGRAFVVGDENDGNGATAEVFDPFTGIWSVLPTAGVGFADAECELLPGGDVLVSPVSWKPYPKFISVIYSPAKNSWSFPGSSLAYQDEASWVKLPDDSILSIDYNNFTSERFIPSSKKWIPDASIPVAIYANGEMGPGFLLPNGKAFFLGGSGHTVLYTPSPLGGTNPGTWAQGPDTPGAPGYHAGVTADAPGAMMVNGRILCAVGPSAANGGSPAPTWFYEFDHTDHTVNTNGSFRATSSPGNAAIGSSYNDQSNAFSMLALPDGTILCCNRNSSQLYIYQPDTAPLPAGKPTINSITLNNDGSYHLTGTKLNGISEGAAFGDEGQGASNYPLVRLTDSIGNVLYGRTYNWSSTGVRTGTNVVSTEFKAYSLYMGGGSFYLPGHYSLVVVANGIASDPVGIDFPVWVDFSYPGPTEDGTYDHPFNTLAKGVSHVASGGTINIKPGASTETLTISKPMDIVAFGGVATIGH